MKYKIFFLIIVLSVVVLIPLPLQREAFILSASSINKTDLNKVEKTLLSKGFVKKQSALSDYNSLNGKLGSETLIVYEKSLHSYGSFAVIISKPNKSSTLYGYHTASKVSSSLLFKSKVNALIGSLIVECEVSNVLH